MIKKVLNVTGMDLKVGLRDAMIVYIIVIPFALAFILRALTASVGGITVNVAVDNSVPTEMVAFLEDYAGVERFDSYDRMISRVEQTDDVFGLSLSAEGYRVYQQGNETRGTVDILDFVVTSFENRDLEIPVSVRVSDVGWMLSPMKQYGGSLLLIFMSVLGAMIILISLVEEKSTNTLAAMNVSPMKRSEYIIAKGLPGFIFPVIHSLGILAVLDYGHLNYTMVLVVVLSIAIISVLVGFVIGVTNDNVMGAIASLKMLFVPVLASVFGGIFLSAKWQRLLYWSPFYWAFRSMDSIILGEASWGAIGLNALIILGITAMVFAVLSKRIKEGLN